MGPHVNRPVMAEWYIRHENVLTGEILHEERKRNLLVNNGRGNILKLLFGLTGGAALVALGCGASATAATVSDTRLNYEYINTATGNRYSLTNFGGDPLSASDVNTADTFVDNTYTPSITYYASIAVQSIIPTSDPNVGHPFREYGLFTSNTLPSTPTSTSGIMFNHLVATSDVIKDTNTQIVVQITIRF